jgi:hypothetical protein
MLYGGKVKQEMRNLNYVNEILTMSWGRPHRKIRFLVKLGRREGASHQLHWCHERMLCMQILCTIV